MRSASTVLTLSFAAGLLTVSSVQAIGFGPVATATQLGQRLDFAAVVRLGPDEALDRNCVSADVFAGDNLLQPGQVRVTLESRPDSSDRTVRVTTSTVIDEPVLTVSVTVGCSSPTTRRFIAFIDPPGIEMAPAAPASDLALLVPQRSNSEVAPRVALLAPLPRRTPLRRREASADRSSPRRARSEGTTPHRVAARVVAPPSAGSADAGRGPSREVVAAAAGPASSSRRLAAVASKPSNAARLQLEAPAATAVATVAGATTARNAVQAAVAVPATIAAAASGPIAAVPVLATAASAPFAADSTDPQAEALLHERRRVRSLEEDLSRMQADAAASRETVAGLQSRLQRAEAERYANPLVLTLAAALALLALLCGATMWRRVRSPAAAPWWKVAGAASAFGRRSAMADLDPAKPAALLDTARYDIAEAGDLANPDTAAAGGRTPGGGSAIPPVDPVSTPVDRASSASGVDVSLPPKPAATVPHGSAAAIGRRWVNGASAPVLPTGKAAPESSSSVEELIDLEQQAEFFVVLGQDDAAIELLSQHLQDGHPVSPLPHLKLLEIHRRRDDRAGYESIRARFNRDFNAYVPGWDADLREGRSLEEYPDVLAELQQHWSTPSRAIDVLAASLFRRGSSATTFDLPAYRELLSLYSIAQDRAKDGTDEAGIGADVDLLLPLGNGHDDDPIGLLNATARASVSRPAGGGSRFATTPAVTVDLDVSIAAEPGRQKTSAGAIAKKTSATAAVAPVAAHYDSVETVPSALRRSAGHPDESAFVDLVLEPVTLGEPVVVR